MQGKLIVFEGTDGAGKGTQIALLDQALTALDVPHTLFDFPQYEKSFFGKLVGRMLAGELGDLESVPPELLALPFAGDRWTAKYALQQTLGENKLAVSNRYTTSSAVYHAARLSADKQQQFMQWVFEMEYQVLGLPKESLVIYLHVPLSHAEKLVTQKQGRNYLQGQNRDLYEKNKQLLLNVEKLYLALSHQYAHWVRIECVENGELLGKEVIHARVIAVLKEQRILP